MDFEFNNRSRAEVLAPAGSIEIAKAVINAGADAVYLGGDMFGARAYAGNLNNEEMLEILEYAHKFGRKVYLTVNTLLKQNEIDNNLINFLIPFYENGLDAVIVQDLGVFNLIHENFPDLDIHASTQMTQTGPKGSKILRELGATRVVTSREMSLSEISELHKELPDLEIESFVHGALCYSYSGQCLLSSFNGGRSGNRGRCAQPCRMAYDCVLNGQTINKNNEKYILSPKDMCSIPILPDIIEAGVYSLKIEGRMKNITYASYVTSMYRKYLDMYFEKGREGYKVDKKDIDNLLDIYNRGMFTTGYYNSTKGREMISLNRPNHMGTKALRVLKNVSGKITFKALEDINAGDVFEIEDGISFTSGNDVKRNDTLVVNLPKKYKLFEGRVINRMNNAKLKALVMSEYVDNPPKIKVDLSMYVSVGSELVLNASIKNPDYNNKYYGKLKNKKDTYYSNDYEDYEYLDVSYIGPVVSEAKSASITKESILKGICAMGDTNFVLGDAQINIDGNAFLPMGQIKQARREVLALLEEKIKNNHKRTYVKPEILDKDGLTKDMASNSEDRKLSLYFKDISLTKKLTNYSLISRVYIDFNDLFSLASKFKEDSKLSDYKEEISRIKSFNTKLYMALPHVLKTSHLDTFKKLIDTAIYLDVDGFLIRSLEELAFIDEYIAKLDRSLDVILDSNMYVFNTWAKEEFLKIPLTHLKIKGFSAALELNERELRSVLDESFELPVLTIAPLMISEQCPKRTFNACNKQRENYLLKSHKGNDYEIMSICSFCYMQMNSKKINLLDTNEYKDLKVGYLRFDIENENDLIELIRHFKKLEDYSLLDIMDKYNEKRIVEYGHFYRGVE